MVNIFVLHKNINKNVKMYCDKHVVKMGLEAVQIMYTVWYEHMGSEYVLARWKLKYSDRLPPYKPFSNAKHPCVIWAKSSRKNYEYVWFLAKAIFEEYSFRYENRIHKSSLHLRMLKKPPNPLRKCTLGLLEFAQAMPDEYKIPGKSVHAYRNYYYGEKQHILKYKKRPFPKFLDKKIYKSSKKN